MNESSSFLKPSGVYFKPYYRSLTEIDALFPYKWADGTLHSTMEIRPMDRPPRLSVSARDEP